MKCKTNLGWGNVFVGVLASLLLSCAAHDATSRTSAIPQRVLPQPAETIPLTIGDVETHRIGTQLVRIIRHVDEMKPIVEIQRIQVPEFKLLEHLRITSITLNGEVLDFSKASAAFLASIKVYQQEVYMTVEFYPLRGPHILAFCSLQVSDKGFSPLVCTNVTPRQ